MGTEYENLDATATSNSNRCGAGIIKKYHVLLLHELKSLMFQMAELTSAY